MDDTGGPQDPRDVPTLRDLIQRHTDQTGESRRALGDRSGMSHQTLGYWSAGTIKTIPDPDTIRLFARATAYSEQTVVLAAARTVGLRISESDSLLVSMLPPGTDNLADADVDAIRAVVRQLVDARRSSLPTPDLSRAEGLRVDEGPGMTNVTRDRN